MLAAGQAERFARVRTPVRPTRYTHGAGLLIRQAKESGYNLRLVSGDGIRTRRLRSDRGGVAPIKPDTWRWMSELGELPGRAHAEPAVGVVVVVVGEPPVELSEHRDGVRQRVDANVVALERPDQGLGEAVALGTSDRGEAGLQAQRTGKSRVSLAV